MYRTLAILAAIALAAGPAVAAEGGQAGHKDKNVAGSSGADWTPDLVWAGTLMGMDIYNRQGEKLGDVLDLVLNHSQSRLDYLVLSYGVLPVVGDKWFAVPWRAFHMREDGKALILDVDKSKLENAPGFDKNRWPDMADPTWARGVHQFYGTRHGGQGGKDMMDRSGHAGKDHEDHKGKQTMGGEHWWMRKYSALVGLDIRNHKGDHLADVENIGIDTKEGRTVYAIASFGGILGIGENLVAIPWAALEMRPELEAARIDTTRDVLDALAFKEGNWPDLTNRQYASQLYEKFNRDPYWEVYGYVKTDRNASRTKETGEAWKLDSQFNKSFKADTVITFNGTIESVGTFRPAAGAAEGYRLRVKKDNGETITVYAGPRSYVTSEGWTYNYGDKVTITGSKTEWEGRSVILPTRIVREGKTLELRSESGEPKWKEAEIR